MERLAKAGLRSSEEDEPYHPPIRSLDGLLRRYQKIPHLLNRRSVPNHQPHALPPVPRNTRPALIATNNVNLNDPFFL